MNIREHQLFTRAGAVADTADSIRNIITEDGLAPIGDATEYLTALVLLVQVQGVLEIVLETTTQISTRRAEQSDDQQD